MSPPSGPPKGRLLIVDDETALVTALLSTMREEGYLASGATNPVDALEMLKRERFDVLLTDLHLPDMDGIAFLRAAQNVDPDLMGILMTGHGTIDTAVDAMKAGAVDYVLKPFKLKALLAVLSRALAVRQLRQENEMLNRRLAVRTQELEAINADLEAFSYSVSHDLRAPLRVVESLTEIFLQDFQTESKETLQDYGQRISQSVKRMGCMIDDLLRMARTARIDLNLTECDLGEYARQVVAKLKLQAPERRLEFTVSGDLRARCDAGLMQLALENLLSNAWKYSGRREVARIELSAQETAGEKIFAVRDNGVGFDMKDAGKLFVPFQRLRSGIDFEGTGVGLATVQRIVQRHNGRIWAESEAGNGATFFFTLPSPGA